MKSALDGEDVNQRRRYCRSADVLAYAESRMQSYQSWDDRAYTAYGMKGSGSEGNAALARRCMLCL